MLSAMRVSNSVYWNTASISIAGSTVRFLGTRMRRTSTADSSRTSSSIGSLRDVIISAIFSTTRPFGT